MRPREVEGGPGFEYPQSVHCSRGEPSNGRQRPISRPGPAQ